MGFYDAVRAKYKIIAGGLPREDYPPANLADMIKTCESLGRNDLAQQLRAAWVNVLNKYPKTRLNWPTANVIGTRSIKKNVFEGAEFHDWLKNQTSLNPDQARQAEKITTLMPPPKDTPPIMVPRASETPESWQQQASQTKEDLAETRKGFSDAREFVLFLENEVNKLKKAVSSHDTNVPKWKVALEATATMLEETRRQIANAESTFKDAAQHYHNAPVTTEAYEKKVQKNLVSIREYISNIKDLNKQRELLAKLEEALRKQKEVKSSLEVNAGLEKVTVILDKIKDGMKLFKSWIKGIGKAVDAFSDTATLKNY